MNKEDNSIPSADNSGKPAKKFLPRHPRFKSADKQSDKVIRREDLKKKKVYNVDRSSGRKSFFKTKTEADRSAKVKARTSGRMEIAVGNLSANLNVMINAAHRAGRGLAYDFDELSSVKVFKKNDNSFVSEADIVSETTIISTLNKARPEFGFISEECGNKDGSDPTKKFIIDPLDGTSNFIHGVPFFSVSIGMYVGGEIIAAVVYNPITDETFYAEKGNGAYLLTGGANKRIRVSENVKMADCLITTGIPSAKKGNHGEYLERLSRVMDVVDGVRRTGSAALDLAYVAAGRFDGYFETRVKSWDIAAGLLLVREAGGYVCDFDGNENDGEILNGSGIFASNDGIKVNLKKILFK